jgi:hypothetical protein
LPKELQENQQLKEEDTMRFVIEIDAALDIANDLGYLKEVETENLGKSTINCFKILSGMIN